MAHAEDGRGERAARRDRPYVARTQPPKRTCVASLLGVLPEHGRDVWNLSLAPEDAHGSRGGTTELRPEPDDGAALLRGARRDVPGRTAFRPHGRTQISRGGVYDYCGGRPRAGGGVPRQPVARRPELHAVTGRTAVGAGCLLGDSADLSRRDGGGRVYRPDQRDWKSRRLDRSVADGDVATGDGHVQPRAARARGGTGDRDGHRRESAPASSRSRSDGGQ